MFVRNAKALCPHLVIIPYDFEAYEEVGFWSISLLYFVYFSYRDNKNFVLCFLYFAMLRKFYELYDLLCR